MGSRMGYGYEYRISMAEAVISTRRPRLDGKYFLFEIRTKFILRPRRSEGGVVVDEVLDSEKYKTSLWVCADERERDILRGSLVYRLQDYWMSDGEIRKLCYATFDFATQHASLDMNIFNGVVLLLHVCTVQQEGESLDACRERAIMAEHLVPLMYVLPMSEPSSTANRSCVGILKFRALMGLRRIRVDNVERALMRGCRICLRNVAVGAQISVLPCYHSFHSHCILRWLEDSNLCPVCYSDIFS